MDLIYLDLNSHWPAKVLSFKWKKVMRDEQPNFPLPLSHQNGNNTRLTEDVSSLEYSLKSPPRLKEKCLQSEPQRGTMQNGADLVLWQMKCQQWDHRHGNQGTSKLRSNTASWVLRLSKSWQKSARPRLTSLVIEKRKDHKHTKILLLLLTEKELIISINRNWLEHQFFKA